MKLSFLGFILTVTSWSGREFDKSAPRGTEVRLWKNKFVFGFFIDGLVRLK